MKPFLSLLFCWCSIACNAQIQAQPVDPLANDSVKALYVSSF